jgi:serine/threonine protein phosphatase PrpC
MSRNTPPSNNRAGIYKLTNFDLNQTTPTTFLKSLFEVIKTNLSFSESQQHCRPTLNVTLQTRHEKTINITTENTGDSRAILIHDAIDPPGFYGLEPEALWKVTILNNPGNPLEKEYIEANGGTVTQRQGSPHQHFNHITIPGHSQGFVINACDGLWDVLTPKEVADYITPLPGDNLAPDTLANGLRQLASQAGRDNISVVVTPIICQGKAPVLSFVADGHGGSFVSQFIHQQMSEFETAPELITARISAQTYLTEQINETPDLQHSPQELANILYAFVNALDKFQKAHPDSSKLETCQALAIDLLRQKKPEELLGGLFSKIGAAIAADNHQGGYGNFFRTHRFRDCLTAARTAAYEALSPNHKIVLLYDETITKLESYTTTHQGQKRQAACDLLQALDDARNKIMEDKTVLTQLKQYLTLPYLTQPYVNIRSALYKISLESSNKLYELLHQRDLSLLTQESHKEILKLYHETTQDIELYISKHSSNSERDGQKTRAANNLLKLIEDSRKKLLESDTKNNNTTTVTTVLDPCIDLDSDIISANSKLRDIWNIFQQAFKQQTENNNISVNKRPPPSSFKTLVVEAKRALSKADSALSKADSALTNANHFMAPKGTFNENPQIIGAEEEKNQRLSNY